MSMQSKFAYLEETKRQIRQAIIDKGVSVSENDTFRSYVSKIGDISGGGSEDLDAELTAQEQYIAELEAIIDEKSSDGELPYIELEYIEGTGTQYIDTNVKPKHTMVFETDVELTTLSENVVFWGSRNDGVHSSNNNQCYLNYFTQTSDYIYCYTTATTDYNSNWHNNLEVVINTPFHLKNITCVSTMVDSNYNITLFGLNNIGVMAALSKCRIGLFRVKDNDVLIANFIPVKRKSDNEICMYDKVTKTFFTNQGTGNFIAGPEIG